MEDFIITALIFAAGWYAGYKISAIFHMSLFKTLLKDLNVSNKDLINVARKIGKDFMTEEQKKVLDDAEANDLEKIEIKVEKHGETLYAFRADNDQFLGQGSTRDDLIAAMAQRIKNVHCTVVEGNEYMKQEA